MHVTNVLNWMRNNEWSPQAHGVVMCHWKNLQVTCSAGFIVQHTRCVYGWRPMLKGTLQNENLSLNISITKYHQLSTCAMICMFAALCCICLKACIILDRCIMQTTLHVMSSGIFRSNGAWMSLCALSRFPAFVDPRRDFSGVLCDVTHFTCPDLFWGRVLLKKHIARLESLYLSLP